MGFTNRNYPTLDPGTVIEVSRVATLSLNTPDTYTMTVEEALRQKMFHTSRGTMSVWAHVIDGPHKGASVCLDYSGVARARYDPREQHPDGRYLLEDD
jgi:hypothetical protein